MIDNLPILRRNIIRVVAIGWFLGCVCIWLPIGLAAYFLSWSYAGAQVELWALLLLGPIFLAVQGLLIGLVVRIGLGLYQFLTRKRREEPLPIETDER